MLLALALGLAGCASETHKPVVPMVVARPPRIPDPVDLPPPLSDRPPLKGSATVSLEEPEPTPQERFLAEWLPAGSDLEAPVTRLELTRALKIAGFLTEPTAALQPMFRDVPPSHAGFSAVQALSQKPWIVAWFPKGVGERFEPAKPVTRLEWCRLYAAMSGKALPKSPELARPPGDDAEPGEPGQLGDALDYDRLPVGDRSAVALAYQEGALERFFSLTPEVLMETRGLRPNDPLSKQAVLAWLSAGDLPTIGQNPPAD